MSLVLLICVGAAGVINYCTAYEYSYNGHSLGYVKSKDEVLQITDMVQKALTEDKSMQVIIDARDDIEFQRVSTLDRDVTIDSSEDVLRRMTYIGDLNVKAYGIYVNGDKLGAVRSKDVAAEVLKKIEERYSSDKEGSVIEKAEILETLDVHMSNTSLRHVYSAERMADSEEHRQTLWGNGPPADDRKYRDRPEESGGGKHHPDPSVRAGTDSSNDGETVLYPGNRIQDENNQNG